MNTYAKNTTGLQSTASLYGGCTKPFVV
jgi:hypothetical protein